MLDRVPAGEVMHIFRAQAALPGALCAGPRAGADAVAPLDDYEDAALEAAKVQATLAVLFLQSIDGMDGPAASARHRPLNCRPAWWP